MSSKRILVTGGAGFIGSHTVGLLLGEDHEVVVLDNLSSGKLDNLDITHPNLEFIEGDVLEYPFIEELVGGVDAVLHLAAIASVQRSLEDPIYTFQVNTQGFLHVLLAATKAPQPVRVVYASSAAVYGEAIELPCRDDAAIASKPISPYALQKIHCEHYANLYSRLFGVKSLGLRYFNVYGVRQDPDSPYSGVISKFLDAYKKGDDLTVFGDGEQSRDFIYVEDVARANALALTSDYAGAINIATGAPKTLLQMIGHMEIVGGKPATVVHAPARPGDIRASFAATEVAAQKLGFKAKLTLADGLKLMMG